MEKGLGKRIIAMALAVMLLATSTDYRVFAEAVGPWNTETVSAAAVTDWHWNDDNDILVDGALDIAYSGDADDILTWKEVKDELPASLTAVVDGTEQTVPVSGWNCKEAELADDTNLFALGLDTLTLEAALPEEYAIGDAEIAVRFSGIAETAADTGKYVPLTVSSGFDTDVVMDKGETTKNTTPIKSGSKYFYLYSADYGKTNSLKYGLPSDGEILDNTTDGLYYKMAGYKNKNALVLSSSASKRLDFDNGAAGYQKVHFLCLNASTGSVNFSVKTYDAETRSESDTLDPKQLSVSVWTNSNFTNCATDSYEVIDKNSKSCGTRNLIHCYVTVDPAKRIDKIMINSGGSGTNTVCILGVTGEKATINAPNQPAITNVGSNSFTAKWNSVTNASSYQLDVATDSSFKSYVSGYQNKTVSGTSCTVTNLTPGKIYYVRVRAVASWGPVSGSSGTKTATTSNPKTITYDPNGGTGTMADTVLNSGESKNLTANAFTYEDYYFNGWNTKADGTGTAYTDGQLVSDTEITDTSLTLYAQWASYEEVALLNGGYAYGSAMSSVGATLTVDVAEESNVGYYIWQMASAKDALDSAWTNIGDKKTSSAHSDSIALKSDQLKDGYWYRCVVNGKTASKPVQLLIANGAVMTNVTRAFGYRQWYVSNGYVAYTAADTSFDVLGKYEKNGTYYWLQTSYSGGWRMYTSTRENPVDTSYYSVGDGPVDKLKVAFSDTDNFNMQFEAVLKDGQKSFAFGCDTMLGNSSTSGRYSDYASLKAIKNESDAVKQIQMVGAYSVDTAKAEDTSFVLKYVDGYAPTYYWLGRYYSRRVFTNADSIDDVINTDSGMTSSWCNVNDGHVKFEFHVGAVADTGAQITMNVKSETDSITIYAPDSSYSYALYKYVDGREEEVSPWQQLSGNSYEYPDLEPDTKYVLKAQKNGETASLDIYTKIATKKGSDENDITSSATSSGITIDNVKASYQYALEDAYGNKVTGYKTPDSNRVDFSGLKAGTTYYLVAKSGENELSEKVKVTTAKAKLTFDANTDDTVTGMPSSMEKTYGSPVQLPSAKPERSGYQFAGWTNETYKAYNYVLYRAGSTFRGETDTTLYAVWYDQNDSIDESAKYYVWFNANTADTVEVPTTGTKSWGVPFTINGSIPVRIGYEFKEWNTNSNGSGQAYAPGDDYLLNQNVTLYAIWEDKYQTVTVEQSDRYTASVKGGISGADASSGKVQYGHNAEVVFSANDSFDFSEIKAYANGTVLNGTLSDDRRSYTVNIPDITEDQYITVSDIYPSSIAVDKDNIDFGSKIQYQQVPDAVTVTVTNDGEKVVTLNEPVMEKEDSNFVIGELSITKLEAGASASFTVQPKTAELTPGVYEETVSVTTTTGVKKTVAVRFTVEADETAPTGKITLTDTAEDGNFFAKNWDSLFDFGINASYGIYYNRDVKVSLAAADSGSGLDKIMYCIAKKGMTAAELKQLEDSAWTAYIAPIALKPYQTAVFYAKLTDKAGNVSYLSTEGIVLDDCAPVITDEEGNEVSDKAEYTGTQKLTFDNSDSKKSDRDTDEKRMANDTLTVTVDGENVELSEDGSYAFVPRSESYHIVAKDKAGNTTSVSVTVNWNKITVPQIASKTYTGGTLTADIADTDVYEVSANNGGTAAGAYDVTLMLKDTVNNKWEPAEGLTLSDDATVVTSKFYILKADNEFATALTCDDCVYGNAPNPSAAAKFGTVTYQYYYAADGALGDRMDGVPTDAGSYYVIASVDDCVDYTGLTSEKAAFTITNAPQAAPADLTAVDETIDGKADGKITNLTTDMQWRVKRAAAGVTAEMEYQNVTDPDMTFAAGTYEVRYAAKKNYDASEASEVTVQAGRKLAVTVPKEQTGYELKADKDQVSWNGTASFTFRVKAGYSKCADFAITVNGNAVEFTENEDNTAQYTISDITEDTVVAVTGVKDITAPEGSVTVGALTPWKELFNKITFNLFFKERQEVAIEAHDEGSGVKETAYFVYEPEEEKAALTADELAQLDDSKWTAGSRFAVEPDKKLVIYARLTDNDGNTSYLSSDGIILDETAPVITGIAEGESYCEDQVITVTDANLDKVIYADGSRELELAPTDGQKYTLPLKESTPLHGTATVTVTAVDRAGNETACEVKAEHDYSFSYVVPPTVLDNGWTTHVCRRNGHQCGQTYDDTETPRLGADGLAVNDKAALSKVKADAQQRIDKNIYADEAEKEFYQDIIEKSGAMLTDIERAEDLKQEIDEINIPAIVNPTADDSDKLNAALTKVNELLDEENADTPTASLTEEQKKQLEQLKESIEQKLDTIEQVKESITFIEKGNDTVYGVDGINKIDEIMPEHQDAIGTIMDEISDLIEKNGANLTEAQKDTLDEYNAQMLDKLKEAATKDLDEQLENAKKQIKSSISDEKKQAEALEKAKKAVADAKSAIDQAVTKDALIDARENAKINLEAITGTKTELAQSVKDNIERIFDEKKQAVENMSDLTEEQKQAAWNRLEKEKSDAFDAIASADSKSDIVKAFETVCTKFDTVEEDSLAQDLANAVEKAKAEIDQKSDDAKAAIDAMPNLSDKEKKAAKKNIDAQAEAAKKELEAVTDPAQKDTVSSRKETGLGNLDKAELDAANDDIKNMKEAAKTDIVSAVKEAKAEIDAMEDLTAEQKEAAKAEIDKKADEAAAAIESIKDTADKTKAEEIRADITKQKDAVSETAKKQKTESENTNNINKAENIKKAEEAEKKLPEIFDNLDIRISTADEVSIKSDVENALAEKEITNADVTVTGLKKKPAKLFEKGSVTGTVEVKVGSQTKVVKVDKELPELSNSVTYTSKVASDAPKSNVSVDENTLMDKTLTQKDLDVLANGGNSDIVLHVQNKEIEPDDSENKCVEEILTENAKVGKYLDISLFLNVTDAEGRFVVENKKIHEPETSFTISVNIPEKLKADGRTYQIVRVHDGTAETLSSVYDAVAQTLTFETDRFSTYAIIYKDAKQEDHGTDDTNGKGDGTGNTSGAGNTSGVGNTMGENTSGGSSAGSGTDNTKDKKAVTSPASVSASTAKAKNVKSADTGDTNNLEWIVTLLPVGVYLLLAGRRRKKY